MNEVNGNKFKIGDVVDVYVNHNGKRMFLAVGEVVNYNDFREPSMAYGLDLFMVYDDVYFAGEDDLEVNNDSQETLDKLAFFVNYYGERRGVYA